jgi:hypothetical protein
MLYVKGIYVGEMPDKCKFSYNLNLELDRDRKVANPWSVRSALATTIQNLWKDGHLSTEDVVSFFKEESGESVALLSYSYLCPELGKAILESMKNGDTDVIHVTSETDAELAKSLGFKPMTVNAPLFKFLDATTKKFVDVLEMRKGLPKRKFTLDEIDADQKSVLIWAIDKIQQVDGHISFATMEIVEFWSDGVESMFIRHSDEEVTIQIGIDVLSHHAQLIASLVREVGRFYGELGTKAHRSACEKIFSEMIAYDFK